MTTTHARTESPLQLVSRKGIPVSTIALLGQRHQTLLDTGILGLTVNPENQPTPTRCTILRASWPDYPEAYELAGFTTQQLDRLSDCAFVSRNND